MGSTPWATRIARCKINMAYKSQDMLQQPGLEHASTGMQDQRTACVATNACYGTFNRNDIVKTKAFNFIKVLKNALIIMPNAVELFCLKYESLY